MGTLENMRKQALEYEFTQETVSLDIDEINQGISQNEHFIFARTDEQITIYDRVCDHNGGRLSLNGNEAVCPLHDWKLDVSSGRYANVKCTKEPVLYVNEYELDAPYIEVPVSEHRLKTLGFKSEKLVNVRFLNHACLHFSVDNEFTFATDPWVIGSAFCNGWWLAKESPSDVFETLNACDFIYISHNHPDHLHPQSLSHIRKDMPILSAGFISGSTIAMLKKSGFDNIMGMDFISRLVNDEREFSLAVLKSGDFRDDSGLLIEAGEFTSLLTVDSNYINFGKLPRVNLLCSSFAGGASGFPLCFENYNEEEKSKVVARNKGAIKATNVKNIQTVTPDYFMPYAGFFSEKAPRDLYIKQRNIKNTVEDYAKVCERNNCELLNVNIDQIFRFRGNRLLDKKVDELSGYKDDSYPNYLCVKNPALAVESKSEVISYFEKSGYQDNLVVELAATNDDFDEVYERFIIDFSGPITVSTEKKMSSVDLEHECTSSDKRYLRIQARSAELLDVILHGKPWEDLSIGFQCRVYRNPNIYNSGFWFHFSNTYIAGSVV